MLLPQTKEREYRFKLALRMGLPIFALTLAFISHTFISNYGNLQISFFIEAILLVLVSVYFIFYLIYNGFKVKITDDITATFTREYLYDFLKKEIAHKKQYTLMLISIENISDINNLYGMKNGDKILQEIVLWISSIFEKNGLVNFPIGHIKGGDFILSFEGSKEQYSVVLEMLCLKMDDFKIDNIEVKISSAITDTNYSKDLDYLVEHLFELQEKNRYSKNHYLDENINPNELEFSVIQAIQTQNISAMYQTIFTEESSAFLECFIKLQTPQGKLIFPKTYVKIINKLGLGVAFDLMVIEYIVTQDTKRDSVYALNILPTSLRDDTFVMRVKEILAIYDVKLMFILSEVEYYSHTNRYKKIINSLKKEGVTFTIDRLGSLHTSFLYLRELPIEIVRFDTYYSKKEKLQEHYSVVEGFVVMAHEKGIKTWIKNIEDEESYLLAKKLNIDYIQGKYLSQLEKQE
jgi:EAL domain-containing protein (putative c-di-GMP-specific phosphodiesterase class I)